MYPTPVNTPSGFAGGPDPAPPQAVTGYGYGAHDTSFGEPSGQRQQNVTYSNPNVNPSIKALCDRVRQTDPQVTMNGLLRHSPVRLAQVVLVDGNCIDFHSLGICKRGHMCKFQHDPTARPSPDRVANFLTLMKPVVEAFQGQRPAKRARGPGPGG
jgi:hypothetical protein